MADREADSPVAIVTGGGTGIGAAAARRLATDGYRVVLTGRRPEPLEEVAQETGGLAVPGDVTDPEHADRVVARATEHFGRLDGLVMSAGIWMSGTAATLSIEDWNRTIQTNLTGSFLFVRAAMPELLRAKGSIVSVASTVGMRANIDSLAYCASKGGLIRLIQCVAADHAAAGVRANVVCPGVTRTELAGAAVSGDISLEAGEEPGSVLIPQRRFAETTEVAAAIAWLMSPESSYVNGTVLPVDGASHALDAGILGSTLDVFGWSIQPPAQV